MTYLDPRKIVETRIADSVGFKKYKLIEEIKNSSPTFETIIRTLYRETGNVEASFSSKMLATINADMPVWDRYVVNNLCLNPKGKTKEEQLQCAIDLYDQMIRHRCFIVRSARIRIDHTLLALPGTKPDQIREVCSHEQAIQQCSAFLAAHPEWRVNVCTNTAAAARMVRDRGRADMAAISSAHCASLYGLEILQSGIQNNSNNHTRFICISKKPEIFPGANRTSLMLVLPDRPGVLYQVLSRFNAQGVNLTKLESRPIPGRDFEFMFYFDLDASVGSPSFSRLIEELDVTLDRFTYLGSYSEVI